MEYRNARAYYRLVYPRFLRPVFRVGTAQFAVADLSERGLRYLAPGPPPAYGLEVQGTLHLPGTAAPLAVEGTVIRREPPYVAVALSKGVPFSVMLDQQRLLQQRILV